MLVHSWVADLEKSNARHNFIRGGRWSSKTYELAQYFITEMVSSNIRILVAREYQNSIAESNLQTMKEILEREGMSKVFDTTGGNITCNVTGSVAMFKGIKTNPQSVRSMQGLTYLWYEEAQYISNESMGMANPTVRGEGSRIFYTYNPTFEEDPVEQLRLRLEPQDKFEVVVNWSDLHESLQTKELLDEQRSTNPAEFEHVWNGEYKPIGVSNPFGLAAIQAAVNRDWVAPKKPETVAGVDVAYTDDGDRTAVVRMDRAGNVLEEVAFRESDSQKRNHRIYEIVKTADFIRVDGTEASGRTACEYMRKLGLPVKDVIFTRENKHKWVTIASHALLQGKATMHNCPALVKEVKLFSADGNGKYEASSGHDDRVCAWLLAYSCLRLWGDA